VRFDLYTKTILTLIALLLSVVVLKPVFQPQTARAAGSFAGIQFSYSGGNHAFFDTDNGEVWEYGAAVDVLGRIIEVVSGMDLDRFVEERVTKPLGMSSTGFYVREADRERLAQPQIDPATGKRPPMFDATQKPKLFSGGGGAVSTASDYLLFCEMLLHGGKLGTTRLLSQPTINLMTSNALKPGIAYSAATLQRFGDIGPTPAMGQGFGLGFAVRTEAGQNPLPGSTGSFYWTGAYGTTFFIDPKQQLIIIMMIQVPLPAGPFYRHEVRYLAYQALSALD